MRQLSDSDVLANIEPNEVYSTLHLYNEIATWRVPAVWAGDG